MKRLLFILILASLACGAPITAISSTPAPKAANIAAEIVSKSDTSQVMTVCNSGGLNVRAGAGTDFPTVTPAPLPDGVQVLWTGRQVTPVVVPWYEIIVVIDDEPYTGWVFSKYLCK